MEILHFKSENSTDILESKTNLPLYSQINCTENVEFTHYFFPCIIYFSNILAHLAVIDNTEEEQLFKNAAHQLNADQVWIGMHDQFTEGDWVTVLDKPVNDLPYKHWILNNPNNDFNSENCGTYWKPHDGWNDARCDGLFPFYCEIDLS